MPPKRILLLDRDGIINKKKRKGDYVINWKEFKFIKKNIRALKLLNKNYNFIVITNQAGVSKKYLTKKRLNEIHKKMCEELLKFEINIKDVFVCVHCDNDLCNCRKPKPALFYKAAKKHNFDLQKTIYIGDDPRDCVAAYNSGCKSILINKKKIYKEINKFNKPICIKNNILECITSIDNFYKNKKNA